MYLLRKDTFSRRGDIFKMWSLHNFQVSDSLVDRDNLSHQQRRLQAQCTVGWENISWACQGAPFQLYPRCSFLCGMNDHGGKSSLAKKLILDSFLSSLMCFFPVGGCSGTVVLSNPVVPHRYLFFPNVQKGICTNGIALAKCSVKTTSALTCNHRMS